MHDAAHTFMVGTENIVTGSLRPSIAPINAAMMETLSTSGLQ
ncbi:hypothetical protein NBRC3293_0416 [Gluconobacter oxydans NBRC 3293]|uniref:Uncharacterized protein n=1 Tax=Gluconobacter oxydans NBRC 3293 TaxID=1315969 RepID=A0A829X2L2_GLUOY|nr:hypothetical protein NBRC3293_0416 [Gluconobacter oxydans NBRC 3293]